MSRGTHCLEKVGVNPSHFASRPAKDWIWNNSFRRLEKYVSLSTSKELLLKRWFYTEFYVNQYNNFIIGMTLNDNN